MTFSDIEIKALGALIDIASATIIVGIGLWAQRQHVTNKAIKNADLRAAADHATDSLQTLADNIVGKEAAMLKDNEGNIVSGKLSDVEQKAINIAKKQVEDAAAKEVPWAQNLASSQIENAVSGAIAKLAGTQPDAVKQQIAKLADPPSASPSAASGTQASA